MDNLPNKSDKNSLVNQEKFSKEISNQKSKTQILLNKKLSLLQRMFPSVEQKAAKNHIKEILEQESKSELEKHRMSNEFFNQALQATFDDVLTRGVVTIQKGQSQDFLKISADTIKEINQMTLAFFKQMELDEAEILKMKSERMRTRQISMLEDRINEFEDTVQYLMQKLKDAAKKSVGKKED